MLDAAAQIAREQGVHAITVGEVAKRAGIARSTVYDYFNSGSDIVADVLVDELTDMAGSIAKRVHPTASPQEAVQQWIRAMLEYITDGRHRLVRDAAAADLPPTRKAQLGELHRELMTPLVGALMKLGVHDASRVGYQINSVIDVCVRRIEAGHPADAEVQAAEDFILRGLSI